MNFIFASNLIRAYCLLQQTFHLDFYNISFLFFLKERHKNLFVKYNVLCILFSSLLFCSKMFRNLVFVIIAFDNSLLKKGIWLPQTCFFYVVHVYLKHILMWQNLWKPSLRKFSLNKLLSNISIFLIRIFFVSNNFHVFQTSATNKMKMKI